MEDKSSESGWKAQNGLADDRTYIRIYPTQKQKTTWKEEAENQGFNSLSKYLIYLIQDARAREQLDRAPSENNQDDRIEELQSEIEGLKNELERARQSNSSQRDIHNTDILRDFLTPEAQTLDEILKTIVESGVLDQFLRKRIEDQLYQMAENDDVVYDRQNGGWRLPMNRGDS